MSSRKGFGSKDFHSLVVPVMLRSLNLGSLKKLNYLNAGVLNGIPFLGDIVYRDDHV